MLSAATALAATGAQAQTCVGTTDIVCTYTGASGAIGDPPSGPVSGSTNLTNILTATGTATGIWTVTGESGDATTTSHGTVNGSITTVAGISGGNTFLGTATVYNHGAVNGRIFAKTDNAADAIIYNDGYVTGPLIATTNAAVFGSPKIYNSGYASSLVIRASTSYFGEAIIVNSGTTGLISSIMFGASTVINSGLAAAISNEALQDMPAKTINSGTVTGEILTTASSGFTSGAETINSGSAGKITTTATTLAGHAITTNYATGFTGKILTQSDGGDATTINYGLAEQVASTTNNGKATVANYGSAGPTALNQGVLFASSQSGSIEVFNSGTAPGPVITRSGSTAPSGAITTVTNTGSVGAFDLDSKAGSVSVLNSGTVTATVLATSTSGAILFANAGFVGTGVQTASDRGSISISNTGLVRGAVAANADAGPGSVTNSGSIHGVVTVTSGYNGSAGPGSFLTNSGLIDGTGYYAAIDVTSNVPDARMTLNLLPGSRVIGRILLAGFPGVSNALGTTINIQSGRGVSSILMFGDGNGQSGIVDTASRVNVSGAPYVVSGDSVAIVDPSSFGIAGRNMIDVTHAIAGLVSGRLGGATPSTSEGSAIGFAPSGNVARDMATDAFAQIPGLAYAGQDRVLAGNPNFTAADGTSVWAQGFGGRRVVPEDGLMLRSVNNFYGGAIGADKIVQPKLRLGAMVGGGHLQSDLAANAGRTGSDLGFAGIYGRYALSGAFLDFSLIGGGSGNATTRRLDNNLVAGGVEYARGNYSGWFVSPELAYGFDRQIATNLTLTPTVRVRYLAAGFGGYQETGSAANLNVGNRLSHYFEERGGVTLTRSFAGVAQGAFNVSGSAGIVGLQRAGDANVNAVLLGQNLAFAAPGGGNVAGYFVGAGIDWRHASGVSLFAATEFNEMSDASRTLTGRGGIRIAF